MTMTQKQLQKKKEKKEKKKKNKSSSPKKVMQDAKIDQVVEKVQQFSAQFTNFGNTLHKEMKGSLSILLETLYRTGIISEQDIENTKAARAQLAEKKEKVVKEILEADMDSEEMIEVCKKHAEDPEVPVYERLSINPVKDLNLTPHEVFEIMRDQGYDLQQLAALGQKWGIPTKTMNQILSVFVQELKMEEQEAAKKEKVEEKVD